VLDTDVCVEILRGNPTVPKRRLQTLDIVTTSWVTSAELFHGAAKSTRPEQMSAAVHGFLATLDILGLDEHSAAPFGRFKAGLEAGGQRLADAELLIASNCLAHGAIVATGNVRHYDRIPELSSEDWIRG
jgi:tRNA(fMet)-specific endonuclease VapC